MATADVALLEVEDLVQKASAGGEVLRGMDTVLQTDEGRAGLTTWAMDGAGAGDKDMEVKAMGVSGDQWSIKECNGQGALLNSKTMETSLQESSWVARIAQNKNAWIISYSAYLKCIGNMCRILKQGCPCFSSATQGDACMGSLWRTQKARKTSVQLHGALVKVK